MMLNLFTNKVSPSVRPMEDLLSILESTYSSFCDVFGELPVVVWCDSHPDEEGFKDYFQALAERFPVVHQTRSLSDGYYRSVSESKDDYLFMLEHDWAFLDTIRHGLDDIAKEMESRKIVHFRFNKRSNEVRKWDRELKEVSGKRFKMCLTTCLSNNPHIVHRERYVKEFLPLIRPNRGSKGVENAFSRSSLRQNVAIYGGIGYPPTIKHSDGRQRYRR